jgi:cytochrome-b5 reductase
MPVLRASYCIMIYDDAGNSKPYSPLYMNKKHIALLIKIYPEGVLTQYISSRNLGDTIEVLGPIKKRENRLNEFKNVLMIAGGTGLTPMFQVLRESILTGLNTTDFTLLFLNKTDKDIFMLNELESLKKKSNGKLQIIHILSEGTEAPDNQHISGLLTKDLLLRVTKSKIFEYVFICGPPSLYDSFSGRKLSPTEQGELVGILKELGYNKESVYKF